MTESTFRDVLSRFLYDYWGAFHEALEAQSVTTRRLAGSLFETVRAEHAAFAAMDIGPAKPAVEELGGIWHELQARRYAWPDPPFNHEEVVKALRLFGQIYDSLLEEGRQYPAACGEILKHAPHGTPKEPLRADTAR